MRTPLIALGLMLATSTTALAGPIESACNASARSKGDRAMCACIQQAADRSLDRAEQRRAARFFAEPDQAQQVRMSKSASDNEFWARYRAFGDMAEAFCAR
ncbi:MAG: hypothetical protein Q8K20_00960 [Gemmobacter sp.]|jgi:hypothetical protein|nr:hypothetical protein [Gemmobacter sp.]